MEGPIDCNFMLCTIFHECIRVLNNFAYYSTFSFAWTFLKLFCKKDREIIIAVILF